MAEGPAPKVTVEVIPSVEGEVSALASANAPFILFEGAPFFGLLNGVAKITLETQRMIAPGPNGTVLSDRVLVAHLCGNIPAMKALRAAIDGVLLLAEPKPEGPSN